jgi:hypothetical protein
MELLSEGGIKMRVAKEFFRETFAILEDVMRASGAMSGTYPDIAE